MSKRWSILQGDVRAGLKTLPGESVHCVMTSPPYWGLRSYGTQPQVWGGDASCQHTWIQHVTPAANGLVNNAMQGNTLSSSSATRAPRKSSVCARCGAWRGELGLEPTPELYAQHLVETFREIRRVLRSDGTVWLNLGDCYAGSGSPGGDFRDGKGGDEYLRPYNRGGNIGLKPKDLVGIPWRIALALQADGWWLRSDIVWAKPNPMPESATDRPAKSHEYVFLLSKSDKYFFDMDAVREPFHGTRWGGDCYEVDGNEAKQVNGLGRNRNCRPHPGGRNLRTVWTIPTQPFPGAHFATFPEKLAEPCVKAGSSEKGCCPECGVPWKRVVRVEQELLQATNNNGKQEQVTNWDRKKWPRTRKLTHTLAWRPSCSHHHEPIPCIVLDPFCGSGTAGVVALRLGRCFIGIELKCEYIAMAKRRIGKAMPLFDREAAVV